MQALGLTVPELDVARRYGAELVTTQWMARNFLVRPGEDVVAVVQGQAQRRAILARWGWSWAGQSIAHGPVAALSQAPLSAAWPRHRCLVLADRWALQASGMPPTSVYPFGQQRAFAIAALWVAVPIDDKSRAAVVLLTVPACSEVRPLAPEQPAIVIDDHVDLWLDPATPLKALRPVLASHLLYEVRHHTPDHEAWLAEQRRSRMRANVNPILWGAAGP